MLPRSISKRWKIHESTQRGLMRLAFLLLIAVPTCLTLVGIFLAQTPWYSRYRASVIAEQLSQQLGMQVRIADYCELSPSSRLLSNVVINHRESKREVMNARLVRATLRSGVWNIELFDPKLQGDQIATSLRILHDSLLCRPQIAPRNTRLPFAIQIEQLTVENSTRIPSLFDVRCSISPSADDARATLTYRHASDSKEDEIRVDLVRYHQDIPWTKVELDTGDLRVPGSMIAELLPSISGLGGIATFQGGLCWSFDDADQWEVSTLESKERPLGDSIAKLRGLQWSSIAPSQWTGQFDLDLHHLQVRNGQVVRASGEVQGSERGGYISRDLLLQAGHWLGLRSWKGRIESKPVREVWYSDVALRFDLSSSGLTLTGLLPARENDVQGAQAVMTTKEESLLFEPIPGPIPVQRLSSLLGGFDRNLPQPDGTPTNPPVPRLSAIR